MSAIRFDMLGMRLVSPNTREHWSKRSKRSKRTASQRSVAHALAAHACGRDAELGVQ